MSYRPPDDLDPYATQQIRYHARRLARARRVGPGGDEDDARQALAVLVVRRRPLFDPARASWTTFVSAVVVSAAATVARAARRRAAGARRVPLSRELLVHDPWPDVDRRLDVAAAVAGAPPDLRPVAGHLMAGRTAAGVARALRLTRQQVRGRVARLRDHLEARLGRPAADPVGADGGDDRAR